MKCRAIAASWFSTFLEKALVSRVNLPNVAAYPKRYLGVRTVADADGVVMSNRYTKWLASLENKKTRVFAGLFGSGARDRT